MQITTSPEALVSALAGAPAVADAIRRTEMQWLAFFSDAERTALDQERQRLAAKYGADSPQAKAAATRLEWLNTERASITAAMVRETIPVPETAADYFVVYGRILNSAGEGMRSVTVTAVDPKGKDLAHVVSDERGVFEVRVRGQLSPPRGKTGKAEQAADTTVYFRLQLTVRKLGLSLKDDEMFEAAGDRLAYREFIIPDSAIQGSQAAKMAKNKRRR